MANATRWDSPAPIRYPDPNIIALDKRFEPIMLGHAAIERIAGGCRFTEGPVWFGDTRQLLWSDIPNDRMMRYDEETGAVSIFRRADCCDVAWTSPTTTHTPGVLVERRTV